MTFDISKISSELDKSFARSFLLICSFESISKDYLETIKLLNSKHSGVVINFKLPSINEKKLFSKNGINVSKISFIDGVCVSADEMPEDKDVHYLMSAQDLDGIAVNLEHIFSDVKPKFILIDLLDPLLIHNSISQIKKSIEYLKVKSKAEGLAFFAFLNNRNISLMDELSPLFDRVISMCE